MDGEKKTLHDRLVESNRYLVYFFIITPMTHIAKITAPVIEPRNMPTSAALFILGSLAIGISATAKFRNKQINW